MKKLLSAFLALASLSTFSASATDVGVFYYPGWNKPGVTDGWSKIKPFKDREPLLGWYKEGTDAPTKTQISWWKKYGINYIAYDWYWDKDTGHKNRTYAIDSFIRNAQGSGVEFTLLWANHTDTPDSYKQFDEIVNYWISNYFHQKNYKMIDGKPVVFIFASNLLERDAQKFGVTTKELLNRARNAAVKSGLKGIYFIGTALPDKQLLSKTLPDQTYDALSAYNYQSASGPNLASRQLSSSYKELSDGYAQNWKFIIENSPLPYIIPVTSGWDKKPWGGSAIASHDESTSTPEIFAKHLQEAKSLLLAHPDKTLNSVVICCWNEFGEGSYIEPTKKYGFKYLEQVKKALK